MAEAGTPTIIQPEGPAPSDQPPAGGVGPEPNGAPGSKYDPEADFAWIPPAPSEIATDSVPITGGSRPGIPLHPPAGEGGGQTSAQIAEAAPLPTEAPAPDISAHTIVPPTEIAQPHADETEIRITRTADEAATPAPSAPPQPSLMEEAGVLRVRDAQRAQDAAVAADGDTAQLAENTQGLNPDAQARAAQLHNGDELIGPRA